MNSNKNYENIYIYGEVLFDCFENGENLLGGAPFNVAWNLRGFGLKPKFLTAIKNDKLGQMIIKTMKSWDMDSSFINILDNKSTGVVSVKLDKYGVPTYDIKDDAAYDFIENRFPLEEHSIFYHGSLALRHENNIKISSKVKQQKNVDTFIDVNLRAPWWSDKNLNEILKNCKYLKLNDEEMPIICEALGINIEQKLNTNIEKEQMNAILEYLDLELLILTKGSKGAVLVNKEKDFINLDVIPVEKMADTVGAGDAFSSVIIYGLYKGWDSLTSAKRALAFASKVCEINGAISHDKTFYENILKEWEENR